MPETLMFQQAPYPAELAGLVEALEYKPLWRITLEDLDRGQGSKGLTLCVLHGPGNDPYMIRELGTDEDRRTSYRGEVK